MPSRGARSRALRCNSVSRASGLEPVAPGRQARSRLFRAFCKCRDLGPCMDGSPLARDSLRLLQSLVGAAMYPTCRCGLSCAAGHNAIRAAQVPIVSSHLKCTAPVGFPDPAVSTGFVHQLLSALSNLVGDHSPCLVLCDGRLPVAPAVRHQCPDHPGGLVGQRNRCHLGRSPRHQLHEPWPPGSIPLGIADDSH